VRLGRHFAEVPTVAGGEEADLAPPAPPARTATARSSLAIACFSIASVKMHAAEAVRAARSRGWNVPTMSLEGYPAGR
jgi:hypothetical protein